VHDTLQSTHYRVWCTLQSVVDIMCLTSTPYRVHPTECGRHSVHDTLQSTPYRVWYTLQSVVDILCMTSTPYRVTKVWQALEHKNSCLLHHKHTHTHTRTHPHTHTRTHARTHTHTSTPQACNKRNNPLRASGWRRRSDSAPVCVLVCPSVHAWA